MFQGAITALITPFRDGRFDAERFRQQINRQIEKGIDGIVPVGTTGESPTLNVNEHHEVIATAIETADGRVPVIAGVGANSTAEAIELHRHAKQDGATAGLSVNPYYNKPTQEGLYRHFMTLAERVDLPIVLYNIPGRCGVALTPQTVARLAEHPNIVAIKEATGSLDVASQIRQLCDLTIISGDDPLTVPLMSIGATGVISVLSNLIPDRVKQLVDLCTQQDYKAAAEMHRTLYPLMKSLFLDGNPAGIKHAMRLCDLDTGEMRLPLVEASPSTRETIENDLKLLDVVSVH